MHLGSSNVYAKRHSRWERPQGGSIQITERDLDYLEVLFEIGPLRANFLHALVSPNVTQVVTTRRLNKLFRAPHGLLDRPPQQRESYSANYSFLIYDISDKGEQVLADRGRISEDERVWRRGLRKGRYVSFWHEVMLGEILGSFRYGLRNNPALRFVSWREILKKAPEATRKSSSPFSVRAQAVIPSVNSDAGAKVVPDGVFGLEYSNDGKKSYRFFALEADRATEPIRRTGLHASSYHRKIEQYRALVAQELYRLHFGVPNLLVLTVTTSEGHKQNLIDFAQQTYGPSKLFLFKHLAWTISSSAGPHADLLNAPWQRAGLEPFDVSKP